MLALDHWLAKQLLKGVGNPLIEIRLWDGATFAPKTRTNVGTPLCGCLEIPDRRTLWQVALDPEFQFGEAYMAGRIRIHGNLEQFLCEVFRHDAGVPAPWWTALPRFRRRRNGTGLSAARKNVSHHYDLGNEFYRLWLDDQLVYTCAYFPHEGMTLEAAQIAKFEHVCRKLSLQPGERVIEAGCGWGAFALYLARHYGVSVRAFNLSREQMIEARRRAAAAGLSTQVEFIEDDWRNITGTCDAFVSIGMLEHVGVSNYDQLGKLIRRCLLPHGRGLIHTIGRSVPRRLDAWTEQRIFPGARPPALSQLLRILEPHRLVVLDVENLRLHYAETLRHWRDRYESSVSEVRRMFGEDFERMWRLYLNASIASFETGCLDLFQVLFAPCGSNAIPRTREHLHR